MRSEPDLRFSTSGVINNIMKYAYFYSDVQFIRARHRVLQMTRVRIWLHSHELFSAVPIYFWVGNF